MMDQQPRQPFNPDVFSRRKDVKDAEVALTVGQLRDKVDDFWDLMKELNELLKLPIDPSNKQTRKISVENLTQQIKNELSNFPRYRSDAAKGDALQRADLEKNYFSDSSGGPVERLADVMISVGQREIADIESGLKERQAHFRATMSDPNLMLDDKQMNLILDIVDNVPSKATVDLDSTQPMQPVNPNVTQPARSLPPGVGQGLGAPQQGLKSENLGKLERFTRKMGGAEIRFGYWLLNKAAHAVGNKRTVRRTNEKLAYYDSRSKFLDIYTDYTGKSLETAEKHLKMPAPLDIKLKGERALALYPLLMLAVKIGTLDSDSLADLPVTHDVREELDKITLKMLEAVNNPQTGGPDVLKLLKERILRKEIFENVPELQGRLRANPAKTQSLPPEDPNARFQKPPVAPQASTPTTIPRPVDVQPPATPDLTATQQHPAPKTHDNHGGGHPPSVDALKITPKEQEKNNLKQIWTEITANGPAELEQAANENMFATRLTRGMQAATALETYLKGDNAKLTEAQLKNYARIIYAMVQNPPTKFLTEMSVKFPVTMQDKAKAIVEALK